MAGTPSLCAACLGLPWQCVCAYVHELRIHTLPFIPRIDHARPNQFTPTAAVPTTIAGPASRVRKAAP